MRTTAAACLLLLVLCAMSLYAAPPEESVDSNDVSSTDTAPQNTTTTTTTTTTTIQTTAPGWLPLVRLAATFGPFAFLFIAWIVAMSVHVWLVRREQDEFPLMRGTRSPQTIPIVLSVVIFIVPLIVFAFFEFRARREISLGTGGVVDQWLPVTRQAWLSLGLCLFLAIIPWLFARRADTVS